MLRCADRSLYVGHTSDLEARKRAHDQGTASNHTAKRRPLEMVYIEAFGSLAEAVNRERQLKRWSGAKKEALIAGDTSALQALSRRRRKRVSAQAPLPVFACTLRLDYIVTFQVPFLDPSAGRRAGRPGRKISA